jgi:tripartite-type tricarboxylate transporter receptor subunit TctC
MKTLQVFLIAIACSISREVFSETYPSRPIKIVVAAAPGGGTDTLARRLGPLMTAKFGQPIIIENKAGASGKIAAQFVAASQPDGYTLLATPPDPIVVAPHIDKMNYNPIDDLLPVSLWTKFSVALIAHPSVKANSVSELVAYANAILPNKLNFATNGVASTNQLAGELFEKVSNIKMVHIPYGGSGPSLNAVLAGDVQLGFVAPQNVIGFLDTDQLKVLAIGSRTRSAALPNIPTIGEELPGYVFENWLGAFAPKNTPPEIVSLLSEVFKQALNDQSLSDRIVKEGQEIVGASPQEFRAIVNEDFAKYKDLLKSIDLQSRK